MTTFEQHHAKNISSIQQQHGQGSQQEADYLLEVGKLVRDFYVDGEGCDVRPRTSKKQTARTRPRKRRDLSAVEKSSTIQAWADGRATAREGAMVAHLDDIVNGRVPCTGINHDTSITPESDHTCTACKSKDSLIYNPRFAEQTCAKCGLSTQYSDEFHSNLTYEQEMSLTPSSNSPYERLNHLNEILAQVQGKESTPVPDDVLDKVKAEFNKNRVRKAKEITPAAVLRHLKKLGFKQWVRHIAGTPGYVVT